MTLRNAAGTGLTKTAFLALTTTEPVPEAKYRLTAPIYESYALHGEGDYEQGKRLLYKAGDVLTQSQVDKLFTAATIGTVSPATGPAVGNTNVTITGTNLSGASGATFGGVAATQFKVVSDTKITCRTGAHAAGAVNVVVADDSGGVTKTNGFTYS